MLPRYENQSDMVEGTPRCNDMVDARVEWRESFSDRLAVARQSGRIRSDLLALTIRAGFVLSLFIVPLWAVASLQGRGVVSLSALLLMLVAAALLLGSLEWSVGLAPRTVTLDAHQLQLGSVTLPRARLGRLRTRPGGPQAPDAVEWIELAQGETKRPTVISLPRGALRQRVLGLLAAHYGMSDDITGDA